MSHSTDIHLQPWMHDLCSLIAAPSQLWCERDGNVDGWSITGFYYGDRRIISAISLTVDGVAPQPLRWEKDGVSSGVQTLVARNLQTDCVDPYVRIERARCVGSHGLEEKLTISNGLGVAIDFTLGVGVEFAMQTMQAVKGGETARGALSDKVVLASDSAAVMKAAAEAIDGRDGGSESGSDGVRHCSSLTWNIHLDGHTTAQVTWSCTVVDSDGPVVAAATECDWAEARSHSDDDRLDRWVAQSLKDLQSLRMTTRQLPDDEFLAAGAPWFFTLFGRDSIWAARFMLPLSSKLACGTLKTLAHFQATENNIETNAEPGKILHELRADSVVAQGAFAASGFALPPLYYGTIDATELWITLLFESWKSGVSEKEICGLLPNLRMALRWMYYYGDSDGDGFLEYVDKSGHGLSNQGWKDSGDSIQWKGGRLAQGPIALCEVQGYAYQAYLQGAELLENLGEVKDLREVALYRSAAESLKIRFNEQFWVSDEYGRYPAVALDAHKRPVDSVASNMGHLLGTGIIDHAGAQAIARRLVSPELFTGFGVRTMGTSSAGYWPLSYHVGSVWAHDTAIAMRGLAAEGFAEEARMLANGLISAAAGFNYEMPELFSGDSGVPSPIPYPASCHPQAWAAASAIAVAHMMGVM